MPYLVPISICAILQLIVLFLFIFVAAETLPKSELDKGRKMKADKDVLFLFLDYPIERIESGFAEGIQFFHRFELGICGKD